MRNPVTSMYLATGLEVGATRCGCGWLVDVVDLAGGGDEQPASARTMAQKREGRMNPNFSAINRAWRLRNWVISPLIYALRHSVPSPSGGFLKGLEQLGLWRCNCPVR